MKIIHVADLHLNSRLETLPTEKAKIRRDELLRNFERLCEFAKINDVKAVILAGDVFDTSNNSSKVKTRFLSAIKNASTVDFLYLKGNHDDGEIFNENDILPDNLKFFGDEWSSFEYENLCIKGVNFTATNNKLVYDSLTNDFNKLNIVVLHGQTAAYNSSDGFYVVNLPKLKEKGIDYLALGHVHARSLEKLDGRGVYAYSGAFDGRGFDELGEKGFYLLETDKDIQPEFITFSSRVLYEFEFSTNGYDDFYALKGEIVRKLKSEVESKSLIKVILKGEIGINFHVDADSLSRELNELFFYAKVYDKTSLKVNETDFEFDKTVRGEFVRKVLASDITDDMKKRVISCGLNALKGEELL
ncbi:MAG: metallophosphoesterase [Clostridia bacterium]|nr:metallophosphoesterase [Clostridia bacterium]